MADDLVPSPSEPQLRGNSREYLLSRLQRGGFTELLGAVDAGELTVYGVATAAGLVTRPTPSGRGSPNARKKRDWAVLKAYRKSARADAALVPETPHNGCSAPSPTACWACPAYGRLCAVLVLIRLLALATYWLLFSIRPLIFLTKRHLGSATFWRFRAVDENHARVRLACRRRRSNVASMATAAPLPTPAAFVPQHLRERLRWTAEHDAMARTIMREFGLQMRRDLVRP